MLGSDEQLGEAHSRPAGFSASGRGRTDKVLMGWNKDCFESQRVFQTNLATNFLTGIEILGRPPRLIPELARVKKHNQGEIIA